MEVMEIAAEIPRTLQRAETAQVRPPHIPLDPTTLSKMADAQFVYWGSWEELWEKN